MSNDEPTRLTVNTSIAFFKSVENLFSHSDMESLNLVSDLQFGNESFLNDSESPFNFSYSTLQKIIEMNKFQRYLSPTAEIVLIVCYVLVILAGVFGNVMVGYVIWRKKTMRTPRNLFIVNLTFSDLSMCVFCMPLTLVMLVSKDFIFGRGLCKLVHVIQCSNILVSISTIVAIAADRYAVIVVGMAGKTHCYVSWSLAATWLVSIAFALPFFAWYDVEPVRLYKILLYRRCTISWPSESIKYLYIIVLMIVMYVLPIVVLSVVHGSIKRYLGQHMINQLDSRRSQKEIERNRQTILLLTIISAAFAVSWLPWQIVNMLADFNYSGFYDPHTLYAVLGSCHLVAMSTACTNPILYGWLNINLRRELLELLPFLAKQFSLKREWSQENAKPADSLNRAEISVTYSTMVLNIKNSPRVITRTCSPVSPLIVHSPFPPSRKTSTPSPSCQMISLTTRPSSSSTFLLPSSSNATSETSALKNSEETTINGFL